MSIWIPARRRTLTPVESISGTDPTGELRVGFVAEDIPEIVANADRVSVPIMDVVALLVRVAQDQPRTIDEWRPSYDGLVKRLSRLEAQQQTK